MWLGYLGPACEIKGGYMISKINGRLLVFSLMTIAAGLLPARGQTLIASNGFEGADNWNFTSTGGGVVTNLSNVVNDNPTNARIRTGSFSWQSRIPGNAASSSNVITFDSVALGATTSRQVVVRNASLSVNTLSAGNGAETADLVRVYVALDGGAFPATPDVRVGGASGNNARWTFGATNSARTYAGTPLAVQAPQTGTSSNNYATLLVDLPNSATSAALRIITFNNDTNELWCLDDIQLVYDAPDWFGPLAPTTNIQFTASTATVAETIGAYTVTVYKSLSSGNVSGEVGLSGTATEGLANDYTLDTTNFTLNGATTSATFVITVNDDAVTEVNETVVLSLANVSGGGLLSPSVFTLTISANDAAPTLVTNVWLNEVDYDTTGTDTNEWVEIIGAAGTTLNDYELVFVSDVGSTYNTFDLADASWTFTDEGGGFGYFVIGIVNPGEGTADFTPAGWTSNEIQNGPADSVQLRLKTGPVNVHFLDYGGNNANTLEDQVFVGSDSGSALSSIYMTGGPGSNFTGFVWTNTTGLATPGAINNGQTLGAGGGTPPTLAAIGNKTILTNSPLIFAVTATPTEGDTVTMSVSNALPGSATFGSTNENGTFEWLTPTPVGVYTMTFYAADNDGADSEQITITVTSTPVDVDGDLMPDGWETQYFGGATNATASVDDDGDGFSNLDEYIASTIPVPPTGSNSYFRTDSIVASGRTVGYLSVTGRLYSLWGAPQLVPENLWTNVAGPQAGNGSNQTLVEGAATTSSYFRLTVELAP
jgi:hypothetical protein